MPVVGNVHQVVICNSMYHTSTPIVPKQCNFSLNCNPIEVGYLKECKGLDQKNVLITRYERKS